MSRFFYLLVTVAPHITIRHSETEAKAIAEDKGFVMKEDAGRGWHRRVPSPLPRRIVEIKSVKELWEDTIVITFS